MATTSRKNLTVKALQSVLANGKKHNANIQLEWELSCNTNVNRGKVYKQEELIQLYSRRIGHNECGATKVCHLTNHNGDAFQHIVLKRMRNDAYIPDIERDNGGNALVTLGGVC